jgi:hypothetical protein
MTGVIPINVPTHLNTSDKRHLANSAVVDALSKEVEEKLNESFTSSSEDLMSLINSGLRQGNNHEDEEK